AIVALAVERFRVAKKAWPKGLEEVVTAKFLQGIPIDPFDGRPIRYHAMAKGRIVYSVGPDGLDNNGLLASESDPKEPERDIGLQIWDVELRRQPSSLNSPSPQKP